MRLFLLLTFLLLHYYGYSQTAGLPKAFQGTFKSKGLDKKYELNRFLKPVYLQADFNGDKIQDIAVLVMEKASKKRGVLLLHGKTKEYFIFGAGAQPFGSDDYRWADKWTLYKKPFVYATQLDQKSGDISGGIEIKLTRPGILLVDNADGVAHTGGIILWDGKKYIWVPQ